MFILNKMLIVAIVESVLILFFLALHVLQELINLDCFTFGSVIALSRVEFILDLDEFFFSKSLQCL